MKLTAVSIPFTGGWIARGQRCPRTARPRAGLRAEVSAHLVRLGGSEPPALASRVVGVALTEVLPHATTRPLAVVVPELGRELCGRDDRGRRKAAEDDRQVGVTSLERHPHRAAGLRWGCRLARPEREDGHRPHEAVRLDLGHSDVQPAESRGIDAADNGSTMNRHGARVRRPCRTARRHRRGAKLELLAEDSASTHENSWTQAKKRSPNQDSLRHNHHSWTRTVLRSSTSQREATLREISAGNGTGIDHVVCDHG